VKRRVDSPLDERRARAREASEKAGVPERFLGDYLTVLEETVGTGRRLRREELDALRDCGEQAARQAVPLADLIGLYLVATELSWPTLPGVGDAPTVTGVRTSGTLLMATVRRAVTAVVDGHGRSQRSAVEQDEEIRREFIEDLLQGRGDPGRLAERADRFGILLAGDHTVTVVRADHSFATDDPVLRRIEDSLVARFGLRNILVTVRDGMLVCIAPSALRGTSGEFVHHLVTALGREARWQAGVGRPHSGSGGVLKSYEEARGALDLARRLGFRAPVMHAADLLVFPVLLRDKEAIIDLVTTVLGPLTTARGGPQPLLHTLSALFSCQGNISATARKLGITSRAVVYRLDRVHDLTGYTPTEPTQRFTLEAAVLGARLLGWPENELE